MNNMSIATHCAMLINGSKRVTFDKKLKMLSDGAISMTPVEGVNDVVVAGESNCDRESESDSDSCYRSERFQSNCAAVDSPVEKGPLTRGEKGSS